MMRQYELVERVQQYKPDANIALLDRAYVYGMQKHSHQKRASGDPYFSHPLEVAAILTEMHVDEATVAVALLHDTIEDTDATRKEIDTIFSEEIGQLVEGLTKLKKLDRVSQRSKQGENLRRLLIATSDDLRVILVKLADRLHNMRTLDHMAPEKRARIGQETMDIYAPLAGRLGMQDMREELETLSFKHINPSAYEAITLRLAELKKQNSDLVETIQTDLKALVSAANIECTVLGRQKKPWSVFNKMQTKGLSFEQLPDVFGFRVIVPEIPDCYQTLGIVHTKWNVVPDRFKDYISTPKQNDYRSLHTMVVGPSRQRVELQIRTPRMHEVAEYGIAAHSLYKDRAGNDRAFEDTRIFSWLRSTVATLSEGASAEDFMENTRLELFQDQVFCFTPKGKLIALPRNATPVDFAYAVHTNIGDSCVGVRINGREKPLKTILKNGDEVEIIRSAKRNPPAAWQQFVVTGKARSAIRRAARDGLREQYSGLGKRILSGAFLRSGKEFSEDLVEGVLSRLDRKEVIDVLTDVGRGELPSSHVFAAIFPDYRDERASRLSNVPAKDESWTNLPNASGMVFKVAEEDDKTTNSKYSGKPVHGINEDATVSFGSGGAVPGDRIVGILNADNHLTIYPIQSNALMELEDDNAQWVDIRWDLDIGTAERFRTRLRIIALNEPGTLASVAAVVASQDANIHELTMLETAPDFTEMQFDLDVWDLKHVTGILAAVEALECVSIVERLYD